MLQPFAETPCQTKATDCAWQDMFLVLETGRSGRGLFTMRPFATGELVFVVSGTERLWRSRTAEDARSNPNFFGLRKDTWLDPDPPFNFLNHSCAPNLGVRGEREFIALSDIPAGAELTCDYALTTDETHWEMQCACAMPDCRGTIRSAQFLPAHVFDGYLPWINPYFQAVFKAAQVSQTLPVIRDRCVGRTPADNSSAPLE